MIYDCTITRVSIGSGLIDAKPLPKAILTQVIGV